DPPRGRRPRLGAERPGSSRRRPDTPQFSPMRTFRGGRSTWCGSSTLSSGRIGGVEQRGDSVTGPTEESTVPTVAEWPEELAAVLTGAAGQARTAARGVRAAATGGG